MLSPPEVQLLFAHSEHVANLLESSFFSRFNGKSKKARMIRSAITGAKAELDRVRTQNGLYDIAMGELLSFQENGQTSLLEALNDNRRFLKKPITASLYNFMQAMTSLGKIMALISSKFDLKIQDDYHGISQAINEEKITGLSAEPFIPPASGYERFNGPGVRIRVGLDSSATIVDSLRLVEKQSFVGTFEGASMVPRDPSLHELDSSTRFELLKEFIGELIQGMSGASRRSTKGRLMSHLQKTMKQFPNESLSYQFALQNIIALALQRDRNACSLFSTSKTGDKALALLQLEKYSEISFFINQVAHVDDKYPQLRYCDLRCFVMGDNEKKAFFSRNREATYLVLDGPMAINNQPKPSFFSKQILKKALGEEQFNSTVLRKFSCG